MEGDLKVQRVSVWCLEGVWKESWRLFEAFWIKLECHLFWILARNILQVGSQSKLGILLRSKWTRVWPCSVLLVQYWYVVPKGAKLIFSQESVGESNWLVFTTWNVTLMTYYTISLISENLQKERPLYSCGYLDNQHLSILFFW